MKEYKSEIERLLDINEKDGVLIVFTNIIVREKYRKKIWELENKYDFEYYTYDEVLSSTGKIEKLSISEFCGKNGSNPLVIVIDESLKKHAHQTSERIQILIPKLFDDVTGCIKKITFDDGSIFNYNNEIKIDVNNKNTEHKEYKDNNYNELLVNYEREMKDINYKYLYHTNKYTKDRNLLELEIDVCLKTNRFRLTSKSSSRVMFTPEHYFFEHGESFINIRVFKSFKDLLMGLLIHDSKYVFNQFSCDTIAGEIITIDDFYNMIYSYRDMLRGYETEYDVKQNDVCDEIDSLFIDVIEKVCKVKGDK